MLCAVTLAPVALSVPAAYADQSWSGQVTASDPAAKVAGPNQETDKCDSGKGTTYKPFNYDAVAFTSTTDGPRTFALTGVPRNQVIFVVLRNGVCVAADFDYDGSDDFDLHRLDLVDVPISKGDQVVVRIYSEYVPQGWSLTVSQPGSANTGASGTATKYVALPEQVVCATGTATATLTKATGKAAKKQKIRSIVLTANGQQVAKVKAAKVRKAVKKGVALTGIPKGAVTLDVVVKLRSGKKKTASRAYSAC
ncbi:hypothetical protein GCM10023066_48090 [Nocardioides kongjuensis]